MSEESLEQSTEVSHWKRLKSRLTTLYEQSPPLKELQQALMSEPVCDIALVMEDLPAEHASWLFHALDDAQAAEVLTKLEPELARQVVQEVQPEQFSRLVEQLPLREAALLVAESPEPYVNAYLSMTPSLSPTVQEVQHRLVYPEGSAGRLMTNQFVRLQAGMTVAEALGAVRETETSIDIPDDLYVVEACSNGGQPGERLKGVVSIRDLVMADAQQSVADIMANQPITLPADAEEEEAASLLSKNKFLALPLTDRNGCLAGVIPAEDLMQITVSRLKRQYVHAVGTDTEKLEQMTPLQAAKLRVPWLLGTMLIELGAGLVIAHFDGVLKQVILLASFMPVISAISGNVGLQAAAITVRALDTGHVNFQNMGKAVWKEGKTSFLMAMTCGLVLGCIGALWSQRLTFGIVIGGALTCSMLTAAFMGTTIPLLSKRLGFDPATTAGPFETAFQDVIGFGVFLWLASLLLSWLV